ncbi:MAG: DEAD/DEAH box helicase [Balneolaceae bacterium]
MTFKDIDLNESLILGLKDIGYTEPTPIQAQSIPHALEGKDILGAAQTGTGKTGAFVIPILEMILREPSTGTKALILSPTRELAQQIDEQIFALGYHTGISSALVIGGEDFARQANAIRAGVDIIVATPGRLIDQIKVLNIDFKTIRFLVLDEADRMLDMGFLPDVNKIIDKMPKKRQTMLFSATMPKELQKLMNSVMIEPVKVQIEASTTSKRVDQRAYFVPPRKKMELVQHILDTVEWSSCIIFCATKKGTNELDRLLNRKGIKAGSIHGDKTQDERTKSLADFKNGVVPVIVATDVLSRGIDIDNISLIINYDVPKAVDDYIHRIGRTGRYDKEGIAISLVSKADEKYFEPIQKKVGKTLTILDPDEEIENAKSGSKAKAKEATKEEAKPAAPKVDKKDLEPVNVDKEEVSISTDADGKVVITLKNKPAPEKKEAPVAEKPKKISVEIDKSKKASKPKPAKKAATKEKPKAKEAPKKKKIEVTKKEPIVMPDRIEKATKRNKNIRKPAKGFWGIIKSFIPRFGKD